MTAVVARPRLRMRLLLAGLGAVACVVALVGVQPVEAAWSDAEVGAATTTAGRVVAPVGSTCMRPGSSESQVAFTWTQPGGGLARSGYSVTITREGSSAVIAQSSAYPAGTRSLTVTANTSQLQRNTIYEVHLEALSGTWSSERETAAFRTGSDRADRIVACGWR